MSLLRTATLPPVSEIASLSAVLLRTRRALALNFPSAVWVRAELAQVTERRGHRYLELVEKGDDDRPRAKCQAAVWSRSYAGVLRKRGPVAAEVLAAGQEVALQCEVDFHEVYGFKLVVVDWDPAFTIGQLALHRREIVAQLDREGLLHANSALRLAAVPQRLAVLTSSAAAGYADFAAQLAGNPFGYRFALTLHDVAVQGAGVEASVAMALSAVADARERYDAVVLLRGGGSRLDLAGFDRLAIGRAIAACPLPILVGIGHETDETLPDLVAHSSLKTPTALADFIVDRAARYEAALLSLGREAARAASAATTRAAERLNRARQLATLAVTQRVAAAGGLLQRREAEVARLARERLLHRTAQLDIASAQLEGLDPQRVLDRGFSLTLHGGRPVRSAQVLESGVELVTRFAQGSVTSVVR